MFSSLAHLICTRCGVRYERDRRVNVCAACGGALFARYHERRLDPDVPAATDRPRTIWRWHEMMPVEDPANIVSLGEGGTPLVPADRLAAPAGFDRLLIKDRVR
jgi:threonine synthase